MALAIATVTDSISKLTVTGLTIKDIDEVPASVPGRNCPILFPDTDDFIENFNAEKAAFGEGAGSHWNVEYDLNYMLLYAVDGGGRGLEMFGPTIQIGFAFFDAILTCNPQAGAVLIRPLSISKPGTITGPDGVGYYGCRITVHVLEFVN